MLNEKSNKNYATSQYLVRNKKKIFKNCRQGFIVRIRPTPSVFFAQFNCIVK